ncbi:translation elongation factor Ts [Candidatus Microgenomates bacterium]|nr:translation elongation factor Ts [Candidatus Microgenomates bacterium]
MKIDLQKIKDLREKTGVSIGECRVALEKAGGDEKKALDILKERGVEIAEKKSERPVGAGLVDTYIHTGGKVGAMLELACETDFVARTDDFKNLAHELAMQVASMDPQDISELEKQDYIRDSSQKVKDLVTNVIAKIGENIKIVRFVRFELGGNE